MSGNILRDLAHRLFTQIIPTPKTAAPEKSQPEVAVKKTETKLPEIKDGLDAKSAYEDFVLKEDAFRSSDLAVFEQRLKKLEPFIQKAAKAEGLDPELIKALIITESSARGGRKSNKGALGPMQVMPKTGKEVAKKMLKEKVADVVPRLICWGTHKDGSKFAKFDPKEAETNIRIGSRYLKNLITASDGNVKEALAKYFAGPGNIERHQAKHDEAIRSDGLAYANKILSKLKFSPS